MPFKDPDRQRKSNAASAKKYREEQAAKRGSPYKCWTLIFYQDSCPVDWKEYLSQMHLKIWVSPIHDKDVWTSLDEQKNKLHVKGKLKKAHFHLIVEYPTPHYMDQVVADFSFLNGSHYIKHVQSLISMVRYLCHHDDPEKAQYLIDDISVFGGAELDLVSQIGSHERHEALAAMRRFIRERRITHFSVFYDYCDEHEKTWSRLLDDNSSYVIEKYIKAYAYHLKEMENIAVMSNSRAYNFYKSLNQIGGSDE